MFQKRPNVFPPPPDIIANGIKLVSRIAAGTTRRVGTVSDQNGFIRWRYGPLRGTKSVIVTAKTAKLYRWDLTSNTLSEVIKLSSGIGEAYTPTIIGADGTVYAINHAILDAIGK